MVHRPVPAAVLARAAPTASLRDLPGLIAGAFRLIRQASGRDAYVVATLQILQGFGVFGVLLAVRQVFEAVLNARSFGGALPPALVLVVLLAATGLVAALAGERDQLLAEVVRQDVEARVLAAVARLDYVAFETPELHDRVERATYAAAVGPLHLVQGFVGLTGALLGVLGGAIALLALQPLLVPPVLLTVVPLSLAASRSGRVHTDFVFDLTGEERDRAYLRNLLTSREAAKEVRAFGLAEELRHRWTLLSDLRVRKLRRVARRQLTLAALGELGSALLLGVAVAALVALITAGRLTVAEAGAAGGAVLLLGQRLQGVGFAATLLYEGAPFTRHLREFLAEAEQVERRPAGVAPPVPTRIDVEGVSFTYPGAGKAALRDACLTLRTGQVVALVGENGSGKTTLAKLLSGLLAPDTGQILWDGTDTATLDPEGLRSRVAVLFEDFLRLRFTAQDNVGMGQVAIVDDLTAIRRSAAHAGADEFLTALPSGYRTRLGPEFEGGTDLSGGQWQRVALARAFFRDAPLVILDEPTAALDPRAERTLFETMRTLCEGRTVLLISHRFASVRTADHIVVLDHGKVRESGDHDALMRQGGLYAELYTLQAEAYEA